MQPTTKNKKPNLSVEIWSINKWLRYTGFRIFVTVTKIGEPDEPTRIGIMWWGFKNF